ncbi:MAG: hypothetical protein KAQ68_06315 [Clostridiales bacterium]|nr:hypothetical protein [Clostridiales bacterium]
MKKLIIAIIIIILAISLYFGINYLTIQKHIESGNYKEAKPYYDNMLFFNDNTENQYYHIANASYYKEERQFYKALVHLNKIKLENIHTINSDFILSSTYKKAEELYYDDEYNKRNRYKECEIYFIELKDYNRSEDYLALVEARNASSHREGKKYGSKLMSMLNFADTIDVIPSNHYLAVYFLNGEWEGDNDMSFQMSSYGDFTVDLPMWIPMAGKYQTLVKPPNIKNYEIRDGDVVFEIMGTWAHIAIINENKVEINDYQYRNTKHIFIRVK